MRRGKTRTLDATATMSLIWPLSAVWGVVVGFVLWKRKAPRERALGLPLLGFVSIACLIWLGETFLFSEVGLGHTGVWGVFFGFLLVFFATWVYLLICIVTQWITAKLVGGGRGI